MPAGRGRALANGIDQRGVHIRNGQGNQRGARRAAPYAACGQGRIRDGNGRAPDYLAGLQHQADGFIPRGLKFLQGGIQHGIVKHQFHDAAILIGQSALHKAAHEPVLGVCGVPEQRAAGFPGGILRFVQGVVNAAALVQLAGVGVEIVHADEHIVDIEQRGVIVDDV